MALFLGLLLGHIIGDFVLQPGALVLAKRRHAGAAVLHTLIVVACSAAMLVDSIRYSWPAVAAVGAAHLTIEFVTIRARAGEESSGLVLFLLDQALHMLSLTAVALLLGADVEPSLFVWRVSLETQAAVCAVAFVAFAGSILIFEIEVLMAGTPAASNPILGLDGRRIYGMAERAAALGAALLLPVPLLGIVAFAPRAILARRSGPDDRRRMGVTIGAGLGLCVIAWVFVRAVTITV